jgi:hypothetical protein
MVSQFEVLGASIDYPQVCAALSLPRPATFGNLAEGRLGATRGILRAVLGNGGPMKARHLIESASFGPDALKVIGHAFDEARAQIDSKFGSDYPLVIEAARLFLANAILAVATNAVVMLKNSSRLASKR